MPSRGRLAIAGPVLAAIGATAFVGCADSADDTASNPPPITTDKNEAAPALGGVTVDVRRDPG
jgi:hypothetical protein